MTFARFARRLRARHLAVIDLVGIVVASYAALSLHFESLLDFDGVMRFLPAILLVLSVRTSSNVWLGLYSRGWRFASVPDVGRIAGAVIISDGRVNGADHKKFVEAEIVKWAPIIKAAGQYAD